MSAKELRDLDAWIAEHVMGWQWWRFNIGGEGKKSLGKWCQLVPPNEEWPITNKAWQGVLCNTQIANMEDCTDLSMFKPSTNLAAAMEVFKKCLEKLAFGIAIQRVPAGYAVFVHIDGTRNEIWETLELTICKFAKKLFGGTDA